jgi:hypothetical protein
MRSDADKYAHLPGIMWEAKPGQVDEIYHLLDDFECLIADNPSSLRCVIIFSEESQVVLNLGDKIVLEKDEEGHGRIGVLRTPEDHHLDGGTA